MLPAALPAPLSATVSLAFSVYLCANVGLQGLLVVRLPAPFVPHSASLGPPRQRESSPPRCPSLPLLLVWMNAYFLSPWCRTSLPLDFLSVLVVRGGAVCLPTPPSWFLSRNTFFYLPRDGQECLSHLYSYYSTGRKQLRCSSTAEWVHKLW